MSNILTNNINPRSGNTIAIGGVNDIVSIAGSISYDDVTNVDSIGIVTARGGLNVGPLTGIAATISTTGDITSSGTLYVASQAQIGRLTRPDVGLIINNDKDNSANNATIIAKNFNSSGRLWTGTSSANQTTSEIYGNGNANFQGNVGIGTDGPFGKLQVKAGTDANFSFATGAGEASLEILNDAGSANVSLNVRASEYKLKIQGNEKVRIDSSGRVLFGTTTSPTAGNGQYAHIVVQGYPNTPQGAGHISLQRGQAAFGADNQIGLINFGDNTGASYAGIECYADADSGSGDYPGRLVFSTTADGASSPTARMRIDSSGRVFIGSVSTPDSTSADDLVIAGTGNRGITINSTDSNETSIFFADGTSGAAQYSGQVAYFHNTDTMAFAAANSYAMRIDSSGRVLIGTSSNFVRGNLQVIDGGGGELTLGRNDTTVVADNDLGHLYYASNDETGTGVEAAIISAYADANHTSVSAPTRLAFSVTAVDNVNPTERVRIDSAGRLLVGTTAGTSAGAGVVQFGEFGTVVSNGGSVVNGGTLDITIGTSNICYWSGFLYVNNIDAASGVNKTQSTFSVFGDNQNQVFTATQIATATGSSSRSFTITYVDNGIIRFTNTSGSDCNVAMGFCGGGINMG